MNIIDKLGIDTPDELRVVSDVWKVFELAGFPTRQIGDDLFRDGENIKKILDDKNEMLEALINDIGIYNVVIEYLENTGRVESIRKHRIELIEKATGKSWEEIKKL